MCIHTYTLIYLFHRLEVFSIMFLQSSELKEPIPQNRDIYVCVGVGVCVCNLVQKFTRHEAQTSIWCIMVDGNVKCSVCIWSMSLHFGLSQIVGRLVYPSYWIVSMFCFQLLNVTTTSARVARRAPFTLIIFFRVNKVSRLLPQLRLPLFGKRGATQAWGHLNLKTAVYKAKIIRDFAATADVDTIHIIRWWRWWRDIEEAQLRIGAPCQELFLK